MLTVCVVLFSEKVCSQENIFACKEELPHLSINDYILNEATFQRLSVNIMNKPHHLLDWFKMIN